MHRPGIWHRFNLGHAKWLGIHKSTMSVLDSRLVTTVSGSMDGTAVHPGILFISGPGSSVKSAADSRQVSFARKECITLHT